MWKSSLRSYVLAAAWLAATSIPSWADNLKFSYRTTSQSWFGGLRQAILLNDGGAKSLQFTTSKLGLVAITFNAECQLIARPQSTVNIDIFIDQTIVPITNGDDSFCSGRGVGVEGGWARYSMTIAKQLAAGTHTVRVSAIVIGDFSFATIDDVTVLVAQ